MSDIDLSRLSVSALDAIVGRSEELSAVLGQPAAIVTAQGIDTVDLAALGARLTSLPCVLIGEPGSDAALAAVVDVVPDGAALAAVSELIQRVPLASVTLALLLRSSERRTVDEGLVAESAAYSLLQGGPEFATWRVSRTARLRPDENDDVVVVERDDATLRITFDRPHVHNAFNRAMRDALSCALDIALADDGIETVELRGNGPSFGSGGDLDEFGERPDPATAHLTRLTRSPARQLARLHERVVSFLHGACLGAGIELPAFGGRIVAAPDTAIGLPELSLGLVPGAGGTVSLTRRIGRHRTAMLALSGQSIDAPTALAWGLVDAIEA